MQKLFVILALMTGALLGAAKAAPSGTIQYSVAVCDPNSPDTCVALKGITPVSAQVTCTAAGTVQVLAVVPSGTPVVPGAPLRQAYAARIIVNNSAATVYLGPSGVSSTTGLALPPGSGYDATHASGGLYCATASGTAVIGTLQY